LTAFLQLFAIVKSDLSRFGARIVTEIDALGRECELNPPRLETYDAWGRRVDKLTTCTAWQQQKRISAEEGLVAIGYERGKWKQWR
jgi:hypothetical protein